MGDSGGRLSPPKKSSIDDIINHFTKDLQSYEGGHYSLLRQPTPSKPQNNLWQNTPTERNPPGCIQQPTMFKQPQQSGEPLGNITQNMYYNNTMGPSNGHNYMQYGNMGAQPHYQAPAMQNNYMQHPQQSYLMQDYGLFRNQNEPVMNMPPHSNSFAPQQFVVDSLVENFVPNVTGTYSPFGNLSSQTMNYPSEAKEEPRSLPTSTFGEMHRKESLLSNNTTTRKPRMVAEVRPMRPSYSAVLTKSPPSAAQNNKNNNKVTPPVSFKGDSTKTKSGKNKKVDSADGKSANGSNLKRQHSGGEDQNGKTLSGGQQSGNNKQNPNSNLGWSFLENMPQGSGNGDEYIDAEDEKFSRKESGRKSKRNKNKYQGLNQDDDIEEQEDKENNGKHNASGKRNINSGNIQWGVKETESSVSHRNHEKKSNKVNDDKKSASGKNTETVSGKQSRRNQVLSNNSSSANKNKTRGTNKRDRRAHAIVVLWNHWQAECSRLAVLFAAWLFNLVWDIVAMSSGLILYLFGILMECLRFWCVSIRVKITSLFRKKWWNYSFPWKKKRPKLSKNINLPATGDEAIRRLLSCKEKDPYSILGVAPDCSDDDIKKYYRRQAILVHPDKNQQAGAEEAFKTLAHAFDLIGEPETRNLYDIRVKESHQVEQAWTELNDLLSKLSQKVEIATNTIRCTHCGGRHRRVLMERPSYAARYCAQCKIHHSAREGDIWAESWGMGLLWHYYACMEGAVYDITEWAACQAVNLKHLKANSHAVQYRIVVGKQHPPPSTTAPPSHSHHPHCPNGSSDPDIEDFLNSLYHSGAGGGQSTCNDHHSHSRQRRKGGKKKK